MPNTLLHLLPYLISLSISLGVLAYTLKRRREPGATGYALFVLSHSLWTAGFILELLSPDLDAKVFWDGLQWVFASAVVLSFLFFAIDYTGQEPRKPRRWWAGLAVIPAAFFLLLAANSHHHLVYIDPYLQEAPGFPALRYPFTPAFYIYATYCLGVAVLAVLPILRGLFLPHPLYRKQIVTILLGFLVPFAGSLLILAGVDLTPQRDTSPFTFAIGDLIVTWGLFRYRTFDIAPIARDMIIDTMTDPVVVLDARGRIVDINAAALSLLERESSQVIGQPAEDVYAGWATLRAVFKDPEGEESEIAVALNGRTRHYEVLSTGLCDKRGALHGRVFVTRDVSARVEMNEALQKLNDDLEARVEERTAELAEAYDTTLAGWAKTLEIRDRETEGHSRRVTEMTVRLARAMGCCEEDLVHIRRGAILHDIGKMAVPDEILHKHDSLTEEEIQIIRKHPVTAFQLLSPIPFLKPALAIPYCHHEHWDGTGYPRGLKGEEIPLAARIFSVVDVWDAIRSDRPYNKAWSRKRSLQHMRDGVGKYFDPQVTEVFLRLVDAGHI